MIAGIATTITLPNENAVSASVLGQVFFVITRSAAEATVEVFERCIATQIDIEAETRSRFHGLIEALRDDLLWLEPDGLMAISDSTNKKKSAIKVVMHRGASKPRPRSSASWSPALNSRAIIGARCACNSSPTF